jgi:hypothetical protein
MHNFKEEVRPSEGKPQKYNTQLRLSMAIAKILKIDPKVLAKNMSTKEIKPYAVKLHKALGDEINKVYEKAVEGLTK